MNEEGAEEFASLVIAKAKEILSSAREQLGQHTPEELLAVVLRDAAEARALVDLQRAELRGMLSHSQLCTDALESAVGAMQEMQTAMRGMQTALEESGAEDVRIMQDMRAEFEGVLDRVQPVLDAALKSQQDLQRNLAKGPGAAGNAAKGKAKTHDDLRQEAIDDLFQNGKGWGMTNDDIRDFLRDRGLNQKYAGQKQGTHTDGSLLTKVNSMVPKSKAKYPKKH